MPPKDKRKTTTSQRTGKKDGRRNGHTGMRNSHPHANVQNICNSAQRSQYGQRHQAPAMGSVSNNVTGNESHSEYNPYEDHEMEGELALHDIGYSAESDANSNTSRPENDNKSQVAQISVGVTYVPQDGVYGRNIFVAVPTSETVGTPLNTSVPPPPMASVQYNGNVAMHSDFPSNLYAPTDGHAAFNNMDSINVPAESALPTIRFSQSDDQSQVHQEESSVNNAPSITMPSAVSLESAPPPANVSVTGYGLTSNNNLTTHRPMQDQMPQENNSVQRGVQKRKRFEYPADILERAEKQAAEDAKIPKRSRKIPSEAANENTNYATRKSNRKKELVHEYTLEALCKTNECLWQENEHLRQENNEYRQRYGPLA